MMESYGVKINYDLIRDLQCALVTVQIQEGMQRQINYPYFPNISNVNRDITAFSGIQSVILPYASSIDLGAANGKDLKVEPILTTSNHSSRVSDVFILSYEQFLGMQKRFVDSAFNQPGYVVAASYYGKQKSFYAGKPIPQDTSKDAEPLIMEVKGQSDKNNRIVAIGDADFADEKSNPPEMNLLFFVNTIDYMADDIGLTQIRTKVSPEALIGDVSSGTKLFVKYFDLLLPPILVVILGLLFWRLKAVRRAKLQIKGNEPNEK